MTAGGTIGGEAIGVVATPAQIDAWLAVAKPGDRFVYATRASLPVGSVGAVRMRELAGRQLVRLHCPRSTEHPGLFSYFAVRTATPCAAAKPPRATLRARLTEVDDEIALADALLPVLERAARFGRPCPTDAQLAAKSGLPVEKVPTAMRVLRSGGAIVVHAAPGPTNRRVTILATGARTGLAA